MRTSTLRSPAGFSLVEIMVALVIGSLAAIIMLQVFALSEERKRTTTGSGDAQSNGMIAFYQLQRDISQAGYGFSATRLFNCNVVWPVASGANIATPIRMAPVTINPGAAIIPAGDANTDTLLVIYGNDNGQPQGNLILAQAGATNTVQMPTSFALNDRVIVAPSACAGNLLLDRITATDTGSVQVSTAAAGTTLYNLGQAPSILAYAIRGGNLTVCDYLVNDCGIAADKDKPSIWVPIANNIVSMRAVYLRDTGAMDGIADTRDQATPADSCGWARVPAVNLALVGRSGQFNKDFVTSTAPTWAENGVAPIGGTGAALSTDASWKNYRYKVFEAVISLRNVGWMGVQTGC
jgi:type IV pilus assembly protein PilW